MDSTVGVGSDLWALSCTIFEIRTGRRLFDTMDGDVDDMLYTIVLLLGKLPEPWWTQWEARKQSFADDPDPSGRAVKVQSTARILGPLSSSALSAVTAIL